MQVLDLSLRGEEPLLPLRGNAVFQGGKRGNRNQLPLLRKNRNRHQHVPVPLVEQVQLGINRVGLQVYPLDDPVIGRIRHPHHAAQVGIEVQVDLRHHPLAALGELMVGRNRKPQEQRQAKKDHASHRDRCKREGKDHLDARSAVKAPPPLHHPADQPAHFLFPLFRHIMKTLKKNPPDPFFQPAAILP